MRRRFKCGSLVWALVGGVGSPALAQTQDLTPPLKWVDHEHYGAAHASANDELVDLVYWVDTAPNPDEHWVYAAGFVTEMDGNTVKGTRMVVLKYDADSNGSSGALQPDVAVYFPPSNVAISQGDTYKAVAMAVDDEGFVYITGEGPNTPGAANNQDYFVVKYDDILGQEWGAGLAGGEKYDGGEGNDIPSDIIIIISLEQDEDAIVVTGTSPGDGTGDDIATVAWYGSDGARAADRPNAGDYWPELPGTGWGDGVRRYNYDPEDGDDRGVELAEAIEVQTGGEEEQDEQEDQGTPTITLDVIVLGTSDGGASGDDFTTHFWRTDGLVWDARFNLGGDDVATGLSQQGARYYSVGYSEVADSFGEGEDFMTYPIDYSAVAYINNSNDTYTQDWSHTWDYASGDDFSADVQTQHDGTYIHVWVGGKGYSGSRLDSFTVHYKDNPAGSVTPDWEHGFNAGGTNPYNYSKAIGLQQGVYSPALPYLTGGLGSSSGDWMLALKYRVNPAGGSPIYTRHWNRNHSVGGFDEGRAIFVKQIDGSGTNFSIWIAGTQSVNGAGREAAVWKYRE